MISHSDIERYFSFLRSSAIQVGVFGPEGIAGIVFLSAWRRIFWVSNGCCASSERVFADRMHFSGPPDMRVWVGVEVLPFTGPRTV